MDGRSICSQKLRVLMPKETIEGESVWEHYVKVKEVGRGNFAVVFSAAPRSSERARKVRTGGARSSRQLQVKEEVEATSYPLVAIKTCPSSDPGKVKALRNEWNSLQGTDHKNILESYEYFENEDECSLVVEYCEYGNLMEWIDNNHSQVVRSPCSSSSSSSSRLVRNNPEVIHFFLIQELLEAVKYLHETRSQVHRDLKPQNVLLAARKERRTDQGSSSKADGGDDDNNRQRNEVDKGLFPPALDSTATGNTTTLATAASPFQVKVADFGLVKKCGTGEFWARPCSAGDLSVMSPSLKELMMDNLPADGEEYRKSDIFAIGVCLYYLMSGHWPYPPGIDPVAQPDFPWLAPDTQNFPFASAEAITLCKTLMKLDKSERPEVSEVIDQLLPPWRSKIQMMIVEEEVPPAGRGDGVVDENSREGEEVVKGENSSSSKAAAVPITNSSPSKSNTGPSVVGRSFPSDSGQTPPPATTMIMMGGSTTNTPEQNKISNSTGSLSGSSVEAEEDTSFTFTLQFAKTSPQLGLEDMHLQIPMSPIKDNRVKK